MQHTAEYIFQLENDKTRLLQEICQLKRIHSANNNNNTNGGAADEDGSAHLPPLKRIKIENMTKAESPNSDSSDEGIQCNPSLRNAGMSGNESEAGVDDYKNELVEVRKVLDRERRLRMQLEDQVRSLEAQLYPERIREIAQQVQLQFTSNTEVSKKIFACYFILSNELNTLFLQDSHLSNGDETAAAVSSVVNDEIVAETIEIETHSCPESPVQPTTIVIHTTPNNPTSSPPSPSYESPQDLSTKQTLGISAIPITSNSRKNTKSSQPAAIALPIDVPFVSNESSAGPTTVTLRIIGSIGADSSKNQTSNSANSTTSRQNLDTIVEAIRHLEGDHLFRDDIKLVTAVSHPI